MSVSHGTAQQTIDSFIYELRQHHTTVKLIRKSAKARIAAHRRYHVEMESYFVSEMPVTCRSM